MGQPTDKPGSPQAAGGPPAPEITANRWQKIKELFGETLERDAAERKAFLDQSCDGNLSLRGSRVSAVICRCWVRVPPAANFGALDLPERHTARRLRSHLLPRAGRDGRCLSRARSSAASRRRDQGPACGSFCRS